jgi:hypothetical protein
MEVELLAPCHPVKLVQNGTLDPVRVSRDPAGTYTTFSAPAATLPETWPSL